MELDRSTVTMDRVTVSGNRGVEAVMSSWLGTLTITNSSVTNNSSGINGDGTHGGALASQGTSLTIAHSTFADNQAVSSALTSVHAYGGALFISGGDVTISGTHRLGPHIA